MSTLFFDGKCTAHSKSTGERCKNPAVQGARVCRFHGFNKGPNHKKSGAPKGNKFAMTTGTDTKALKEHKQRLIGDQPDVDHGFLADEILSEAEQKSFREIIARMYRDFQLNSSSDFYAVELVALSLLLYRRCAKDMNANAIETFDRMIRMHLKDLKATKITRETENAPAKTTPAEWAAELLKKVDEEEKREAQNAKRRNKGATTEAPASDSTGPSAAESENYDDQ